MAAPDYTKKSNKFNHLHEEVAKPDKQFLDVRKPFTSGESTFVKASGKFLAFAAFDGRKLHVKGLEDFGRIKPDEPTVQASDILAQRVNDWDFNPFIDNMLALGAENGRVAVVQFPIGGLTENVTEAVVNLGCVPDESDPTGKKMKVKEGHTKKITLVEFNPSANNILATGSFDKTVKIWNIESNHLFADYKGCGDNIFSLKWNGDGSRVAVTSKDKKLHIFDPRALDDAQTVDAFENAKARYVCLCLCVFIFFVFRFFILFFSYFFAFFVLGVYIFLFFSQTTFFLYVFRFSHSFLI